MSPLLLLCRQGRASFLRQHIRPPPLLVHCRQNQASFPSHSILRPVPAAAALQAGHLLPEQGHLKGQEGPGRAVGQGGAVCRGQRDVKGHQPVPTGAVLVGLRVQGVTRGGRGHELGPGGKVDSQLWSTNHRSTSAVAEAPSCPPSAASSDMVLLPAAQPLP